MYRVGFASLLRHLKQFFLDLKLEYNSLMLALNNRLPFARLLFYLPIHDLSHTQGVLGRVGWGEPTGLQGPCRGGGQSLAQEMETRAQATSVGPGG